MAALRADSTGDARGDDLGRGPPLPRASGRRSDRHRALAQGPRSRRGRFSQGGSTITQQLARNIFLTNSRTFGRKFREAILALALERKFTKDQILELYLNRVYFGGGAYGIDAASRNFFGHGADRLSLGEAAIIAGLVKAPSNYSPTADAEAALGRAGVVLELMVDNGVISARDRCQRRPQPMSGSCATAAQNSVRYFTDWALPQLDTLIDETIEPIDVWTTLDPACSAPPTRRSRPTRPGRAGRAGRVDRDGAVRAMVGGHDYVSSIYNRATQAQRQPGSAFKLFVYLAALESGMKPTDTIVDEPVTIDGWSPRNSSRTNLGRDHRCAPPLPIRSTPSRASSAQQVGFCDRSPTWRGASGSPRRSPPIPSMVLGTSDVRLIDMTRAFASVAPRASRSRPMASARSPPPTAQLLYQHEPTEERVLVAPWVAAEMTDLLQSAV